MRRRVAVLTAVVGLALVTGCESSPERGAGAAAPGGGVTPSASAPAPTVSGSSEPAPETSGQVKEATTKPAGELVLGPDGLGALELGMTKAKALKTGLLGKDQDGTEGQGCNTAYKPKAAGKADAPVFFSDLGLVSFTAYPGVATPEGIKLGSSMTAVRKAYPDWDVSPEEGNGRGWAKVPGNDEAVFNITVGKGKVVHMNLQLVTQNCYE